jgi:hypothetical protein
MSAVQRLAIMQPYLFPYIGYWQLVNAVDRFVVYDDVNYIKSGWINRNRILINGKATFFTVPLSGASPNNKINNIELVAGKHWRKKITKTMELTYRRAAHFENVFPMVEKILAHEAEELADFLLNQLTFVSRCLGVRTEIVRSTNRYPNEHLHGQDRVIDICKYEGASIYINAQGGQDFYQSHAFESQGLALKFLQSTAPPYRQASKIFVPNLSIVDVLMNIGFSETLAHLSRCSFVAESND